MILVSIQFEARHFCQFSKVFVHNAMASVYTRDITGIRNSSCYLVHTLVAAPVAFQLYKMLV